MRQSIIVLIFVAAFACLTPVHAMQKELVPFKTDDKWGYKTLSDEVAIEPRYSLAYDFLDTGIAPVIDSEGWAYIDRSGTVLVRPYLRGICPDQFAEGLARFVKDGKVGFFDHRGRVVIDADFGFATPFSGGRAAFCEGCTNEYERAHYRMTGGRWGYIDLKGRIVVEPRYIKADGFLETGIAAVVDDEGWAYIDKSGTILLRPFLFDNGPDYFKEGLARFVKDGKIGFFDRRGRIVIDARFEWIEPFSGGRATFCEGCVKTREGEHYRMTGGRWGYIDHKGRVVVQPR